MAQPLKHKGLRVIASLAIVSAVVAFWVLRPLRDSDLSLQGFTAVRDDRLAAQFAPVVLPHVMYGKPERMLYRMGKKTTGELFIAYHPFYNGEENPHAGSGAALSRVIYTGGLNIKNLMFGEADIELIEVVLDVNRKPIRIAYEDADRYDTKSFSVRHLPRTAENPAQPFCFATVSWNHMFALQDKTKCGGITPLVPEYFSEADWQKYKMVKKTEAMLRRNRMHRPYERAPAF